MSFTWRISMGLKISLVYFGKNNFTRGGLALSPTPEILGSGRTRPGFPI